MRADGAHGVIGGVPVKFDQNAPDEIGRPSYRHYARSLFRPGTDITGKPGAQNLREDRLVQHITDWGGGEGQVVLTGTDASARRFYRSEGLNFRVPGQVELNRSIQINSPSDASGGAAATSEGSAWSNVVGASTVVNTTDRRLNLVNDQISSETHAPGASQVQVSFRIYKEAQQLTTIEGSSLISVNGNGAVTGDDFSVGPAGAEARTVNVTGFTADKPVEVQAYLYASTSTDVLQHATLRVVRVAGDGSYSQVASVSTIDPITNTSTPSDPTLTATFTPNSASSNYRFIVKHTSGQDALFVDQLDYGLSSLPTSVTLSVRNTTDSTTRISKTIQVTNDTTAAFQLNYLAVAAKNYQYRVLYNSGPQRPVVDKTVATVLTTTPWSFACMELGLNGEVIVVGNRAGVDPAAWFYDFTNEDWDADNTALADAGANDVCLALTHSDKYEYGLFSSGVVEQFTSAGDNDYVSGLTDPSGITICQDRLFVLTEDDAGTNGVEIRTYAVDADVSAGVTTVLQTVPVSTAIVAADTTLRERMCATPTGARFFVNYSDVTSVVYEADASGSTTVVKEIARLDEGTKATCIAHVAGHTFVAAQTIAETGQVARSLLYVIDQSNTPRAIGYFRRDDPTTSPVVSTQPFQQDLWMLQGRFVWRFSLQTGGLFCEYELAPGDESYARSIAVTQGHVFVLYAQEDSTNTGGVIWVAGSVGTYRQASVSGGSSFTSSVYDYGLPGETKQLLSVKVLTDELPSNTSVTIESQTNGDGTWVPLGSHTSGAETTLKVSNATAQTNFRTLQLRSTLNTSDGVSTPTLKAIIPESRVTGFEEFFDVMVLTDDEDASFHIAGQNRTGGDVKQALWSLMRANAPVTFIDAYEHKRANNNPEYLVTLESPDTSDDDVGEGRMMVRMRVVPNA